MIPINASLDIWGIFTDFWRSFGEHITLVLTISITLVVFQLLLGTKFEDRLRLSASLLLTTFGLVLAAVFSPLPKEVNTLLIGILFSPLFANMVDILRNKQKFSNEVDKVSYEYRRRLVEQESQIIGELLGELSTHAAAFKSYGIQEIKDEKWNASFKVGLISDIHTLLIARYYYFVLLFNRVVRELGKFVEENETGGKIDLADCQESFSEIKKAFRETETAIFHTLIFDLHLLQQNYLARPTVEFPIHMSFLLKKRLVRFGILKEGGTLRNSEIFSEKNLERFNLEMVTYLNRRFAILGGRFREIDRIFRETRELSKAQ